MLPPKDKTIDDTYDPQDDKLVNHQDDVVLNISDPDDEYSWEDFLFDNADSYDDFLLKN